MDNKGIKGIIFDYGGTIDTNGIHWMELIWESYLHYDIPVSLGDFREIYIFVEKQLEVRKYIQQDYNFYDVLKTKIGIQLRCLCNRFSYDVDENRLLPYSEDIADECYRYVQDILKDNIPVIKRLSENYRLGVVSNFYGNIGTVLKDFGLYDYFNVIVDSGLEGIRKPNPDIYRISIKRLGLQPEETIVVGDSFTNDIVPAKAVGCKTVWLNCKDKIQHKSMGRKPDAIISSLAELEHLL